MTQPATHSDTPLYVCLRIDGQHLIPADAGTADLLGALGMRAYLAPAKAASEPSLLPCPFCGAEAQSVGVGSCRYAVECLVCEASSRMEHPEQAAIDAWNRRVPPSVVEAGAAAMVELEQLRAAAKEFLSCRDGCIMSNGQPPSDAEYEQAEEALRQLLG